MEYKKLSLGGYNLHLIKTNKFKTMHVETIFHNNVNINDITKREFLTRILLESNNNYQSDRKLQIKLEDLYDASLVASNSKVGAAFITSFAIDFLNPEYADKNIISDSIKLLFDIILNPYVSVSEFDNKTFSLVKERVADSIHKALEDPKRLSLNNALKYLGNTPSAYTNLGNIDDLEEITPTNLYEYYKEMIRNDYLDIFVVGNIDMDNVTKIIIDNAKFNVVKNHPVNMYVDNKISKELFYSDNSSFMQSNLTVLLHLNNLTDYEKRYVANMYNNILGQNSNENKLFQTLREKNSLCYGVNSYYQKYDGLIVITTGVDPNNSKYAFKCIKDCLKEMSNNITDEEVENAKEQIISSLNFAKDNVDRIVDNYFYQSLGEIDDIETRIKTFKNITKDEIEKFSKKVSISICYNLEGEKHE